MKLYDTPAAEYAFAYREQPISGNEINGLGVTEPMRAKYVFHCMEHGPFPWFGLNLFFAMNASLGIVLEQLRYRWYARKSKGPVAKRQVAVEDPTAMAAHIKAKAKEFGAGVVGITELTDDALFEGTELPYKYGDLHRLPDAARRDGACPPRPGRPRGDSHLWRCRQSGDEARRIHPRVGLASLCGRATLVQ